MARTITQSLITGTLLGSSIALGMYVAYAATSGQSGVPEQGFVPYLLDSIETSPNSGKVKNATELDGTSASGYQLNVTGTCPSRQWAVGIKSDNTLDCRDSNW